ncbi:MAG: TetR/AcrR family transcriptional regulator C-terminal domain-containing protein [Lactococcus lactis]|uniref:TetR/AcrR family transcriptional regulator C-terminal domain-containing protein n=1 Tax=Lactococcus lactis subsp. cremoris TaxID=1359 RepID=UPI00288AC2F5|nr:TetR/AcrR family transcriptional regulator C-terminal domain-containing protein [Lactococcus cremoris]MDU7300378.1 TetR/AcrR family transcriptional regulator C-terminal domain-containing protein [Lactococcus lactis]
MIFQVKRHFFAELIDKPTLEIIFPANEKTWQNRLFVYGKNIYAVLESYPNLAQLMMDYPPESENYLRLFDKLLMIVDDLNLTDDRKFYTINLYLNFIYSSKIDSDRLVEQPEKPLSTVKIPLIQLAPFLDKYWQTESLTSLSSSESFEFGLELIISGIEKMVQTD